MKKTFKKYNEFINESLVFLTLKGTMKNEFMNDIELKADYELAKRLFFNNGASMLTHISEGKFELRTYHINKKEDLDGIINQVNQSMKRFRFSRTGSYKKSNLKEYDWLLNCTID